MHLAKTHARHAFHHAIRPPRMVNRDIEVSTVCCLCFAVANEVTELVASRSRRIAELRPRNRHIVRSVGNIQVAVMTVVNVHVVNPHVLRFVIHLEAILVIVVVRAGAFEFQVADDDVLRAAQLHGTARSGLRDNGALVTVNRHVATDFHRTHVCPRLHVDNLIARLGISLKVSHIVHRDLGLALATRGTAILCRESRHRKIRRSHCKRGSHKSCPEHNTRSEHL